jgi:multisubunit Na+/H+ antiporter MnhB subunit
VKVRRHPVLGFFAGLFLGIGIALLLIVFGIIPLSVTWLAGLTVGFAVLGLVGAYAVPAHGRPVSVPTTEPAEE